MQSLKAPSLLKRKIKKAIRGLKKIIARVIRKFLYSEQILVTENEIYFIRSLPDFQKRKFTPRRFA